MEFKKYQHIERFGTTEVEGIQNGKCYIFPKIDGTNASLWWSNGLKAGSRNRELSIDNDNAGFYKWALGQEHIIQFLKSHQNVRLYGEWLVPHTLKTYNDNAWMNFYVFDVMVGDEYVDFGSYSSELQQYNIEYIPAICIINNPSYERLIGLLEQNDYLVKDGNGIGEGIVIKNYDYKNKYGRVVWAKIVSNEFKGKHKKAMPNEIKEKNLVEKDIVDKYITRSLLDKEQSKIENEMNGWSSKYIPRLINVVFYNLIREESWNFVKEFKNPTIDFKRLSFFTTTKIKELKPDVFN
ncbi:RNA ligase family protein [uncultured Dysgonomonas sp.]|uniref:RNA ligase domain-containing protein n=1 Tax=uncultured Dysgonomonas sp. TaxID=206096 RepID=A0A212IX24_9BACT|nr:RNA ligase family protein [uncultured Dysgonomonas sp.]SBV91783.1 conserved hypothetical protein [uncultured Dysgonomonas sp.]